MSDLLAALAEQCCKLEHDEPWRPYAHFDSSRAEALIANYEDDKASKDTERLDFIEQTCLNVGYFGPDMGNKVWRVYERSFYKTEAKLMLREAIDDAIAAAARKETL